jgi:hypothetical protein
MKSPHLVGAWCLLLAGAVASPTAAQKAPSRDRHERREEARDARKDRREEAREERKDRREEAREGLDERRADLEGTLDERRAKLAERIQKLRQSREARAAAERERIVSRWGPVKDNPTLRAEFRLHAWRMARLHRMRLVASAEGKEPLKARIDELIAKERARHEREMEKSPKPVSSAPKGGAR